MSKEKTDSKKKYIVEIKTGYGEKSYLWKCSKGVIRCCCKVKANACSFTKQEAEFYKKNFTNSNVVEK